LGLYHVYLIDLAVGDPDRVSNLSTSAPPVGDAYGPRFIDPIHWSADDSHLAVIADWPLDASELDDAYALFVLPTANNGGVRLVGMPYTTDQDVQSAAFAPSGEQVWVLGDLVAADNSELFATENIWSVNVEPLTIRVEDVPTGGDVLGFWVVPVP
jgi:hypothetical protein